jgi:hypothetical protein
VQALFSWRAVAEATAAAYEDTIAGFRADRAAVPGAGKTAATTAEKTTVPTTVLTLGHPTEEDTRADR